MTELGVTAQALRVGHRGEAAKGAPRPVTSAEVTVPVRRVVVPRKPGTTGCTRPPRSRRRRDVCAAVTDTARQLLEWHAHLHHPPRTWGPR
jgi:hypothetical protein